MKIFIGGPSSNLFKRLTIIGFGVSWNVKCREKMVLPSTIDVSTRETRSPNRYLIQFTRAFRPVSLLHLQSFRDFQRAMTINICRANATWIVACDIGKIVASTMNDRCRYNCFMRKNRAIPFRERYSLLSLEGNFRISCKRNSTDGGDRWNDNKLWIDK